MSSQKLIRKRYRIFYVIIMRKDRKDKKNMMNFFSL
nr:MAG TPA: acriflavine resistance protein B [Caudoviricetes sp.]